MILLFIPTLSFADLYINFDGLSYDQIIQSVHDKALSNTTFIISHPYQKTQSSSKVSDILTNYHRQTLEILRTEAQKKQNNIYFDIDPLEMNTSIFFSQKTSSGKFIPDFQNKNEIKLLINRLLLISQTNKFGLKIDLSLVPEKQRKNLTQRIKKEIPNTIFVNGTDKNITSAYYYDLKNIFNNKDISLNKLLKKTPTTIHFISDPNISGVTIGVIFWLLSQQESIFINYDLLSHRYILDLIILLHKYNKLFKIYYLDHDHMMLYSQNYLMNIHLNNQLTYKTMNNTLIEDKKIIKSLHGSSLLISEKNNMEFLVWPFSIFIWKYQ
ncbi:MAG: hypothetical protein ACRCVW_01790 [Brevinema sp.]